MTWYLNSKLWGQEKLSSSPTPASQVLKTQKAVTPTPFFSVLSPFSSFYTQVKISTLSFKNLVFMPLHSFIKVYLPVCLHYSVIFVPFLSFSLPFYFFILYSCFCSFCILFLVLTLFYFLLQFLFFCCSCVYQLLFLNLLIVMIFFHFFKVSSNVLTFSLP